MISFFFRLFFIWIPSILTASMWISQLYLKLWLLWRKFWTLQLNLFFIYWVNKNLILIILPLILWSRLLNFKSLNKILIINWLFSALTVIHDFRDSLHLIFLKKRIRKSESAHLRLINRWLFITKAIIYAVSTLNIFFFYFFFYYYLHYIWSNIIFIFTFYMLPESLNNFWISSFIFFDIYYSWLNHKFILHCFLIICFFWKYKLYINCLRIFSRRYNSHYWFDREYLRICSFYFIGHIWSWMKIFNIKLAFSWTFNLGSC